VLSAVKAEITFPLWTLPETEISYEDLKNTEGKVASSSVNSVLSMAESGS
jgi:hypothetical protein